MHLKYLYFNGANKAIITAQTVTGKTNLYEIEQNGLRVRGETETRVRNLYEMIRKVQL